MIEKMRKQSVHVQNSLFRKEVWSLLALLRYHQGKAVGKLKVRIKIKLLDSRHKLHQRNWRSLKGMTVCRIRWNDLAWNDLSMERSDRIEATLYSSQIAKTDTYCFLHSIITLFSYSEMSPSPSPMLSHAYFGALR